MKIIKEGRKINGRISCSKCGCIFEYEFNDIQVDHSVLGSTSYVDCPCCHNRFVLTDILPETISTPAINDKKYYNPMHGYFGPCQCSTQVHGTSQNITAYNSEIQRVKEILKNGEN